MGQYENNAYTLGLGYVDPSDVGSQQLKGMMDYFYQSNYVGQSAIWQNGSIDKRFKAGDQALYGTLYGVNQSQNQRFFFNLIRRHLNMVNGYQRRNRKSTVTQPIHQDNDDLADDYNAVLKYCEQRDGFQEYLSQAFEGSNDTGMTLLNMYLDYSNDPVSGDLFTDAVSYNNYLIDQHFRKQDLSDCNGIWRRRWTSKEGAKLLIPGFAKEIDRMKPSGMKDGRFPIQAELQNIPMNGLFPYDEFHYRTTRDAKVIFDPKTGESMEFEAEEGEPDDMLKQILLAQPWLKVRTIRVPTIKLVIALGDKIVYHGANLLGIDEYPFVPSMCYYEPDIVQYSLRCMGLIRNLRDAQFLYNMRKVIELQLLQSQVNAGWIYPVDAVVDQKAFRQSSGGDGYLIPLKTGHLPNEIQRIEPVNLPQSLMELSRGLAEDITKISGVNEELLGSATDDKSGILSMLRQGAGLTTLQGIFDKLDYTQRIYGNLRLKAIIKNYSKGKVRNILGKEAHPKFFSNFSIKFQIAVEEGNYSTTQRQTELQQLLHFKEIGMPIPDKSILKSAFITNKSQVIEDMEQQVQQQQQQQQAQQQAETQLKQQETQSKLMLEYAKSRSELAREKELTASAAEKTAKIGQNESEADFKRTEAELNLVRLMIGLEDLDLANLKSSLELAQVIKQQSQQ